MPKNKFLTKNCTKLFPYFLIFFLPQTVLGRLTAVVQGSEVPQEANLPQDKFLVTPMCVYKRVHFLAKCG